MAPIDGSTDKSETVRHQTWRSRMRPIIDAFIRSTTLKLRDEECLLGLGIKRPHQFTGSAILSESHGSKPFASQFVEPGFSGGQRR